MLFNGASMEAEWQRDKASKTDQQIGILPPVQQPLREPQHGPKVLQNGVTNDGVQCWFALCQREQITKEKKASKQCGNRGDVDAILKALWAHI